MCGLYSDKQNGMADKMNALEKLFLLIGVMCQMQEGSFFDTVWGSGMQSRPTSLQPADNAVYTVQCNA